VAAKDKDDDDGEQGEASFEELARRAEEAERAAIASKKAGKDDPDASEEDATEEDARDASTKGVAKALGVDKDENDENDEDDEAAKEKEAVQNRAARRREDALKRRATSGGADKQVKGSAAKSAIVKRKSDDTEAEAEEEDDDDAVAARDALPKDRNARAKELLKRRQESASGKRASAIGLSAGEVVQDQVARAAAGSSKWLKANFRYVVGGIIASIAIAGGAVYYLDHQQKQLGIASDVLILAVESEYGYVFNDDNKDARPPEQKQFDPTPVFASHALRREAVIAGYDKVIAAYPGSGTEIIAKLGRAGALLDGGKFDEALSGYEDVAKTELAKADVDVRARSIEGKAYALEGKKDNDAAMAAFRELENVDKAYEDLARYHQARIHLKKGEKDKAKEMLVPLSKKLELPSLDGPQNRNLRLLVDQYVRIIDPLAVPKRRQFGGANRTPSEAEMQEIIRRQMQQQQQQQGDEHGDEHGDDEMPLPFPLPEGLPDDAH